MSFLKKMFLMLYSVICFSDHSSLFDCVYFLRYWTVTLCAIWYHLYNLKKREKYPWKSVTFSKVAGYVCNFTKRNTPPWVSFTLFKLYKWYQIAQRTTYVHYVVISFPLNNVIKLTTLKPLKVACRVRVTYFKE